MYSILYIDGDVTAVLAMTSTVFIQLCGKIMGCKNIIKLTEFHRKRKSQGMIYVEFYRAAISRIIISFIDSKYEVWLRTLPQDLVGTGNNSVNRRLFHLKLIMCKISL